MSVKKYRPRGASGPIFEALYFNHPMKLHELEGFVGGGTGNISGGQLVVAGPQGAIRIIQGGYILKVPATIQKPISIQRKHSTSWYSTLSYTCLNYDEFHSIFVEVDDE